MCPGRSRVCPDWRMSPEWDADQLWVGPGAPVVGYVPFNRVFHSVEMTILAFVAAVGDVLVGGLAVTQAFVLTMLVLAVLTVRVMCGHSVLRQTAWPGMSDPRLPHFGVVVLSMGQRPEDLRRGLESVLAQEGVTTDVVVVGNGWVPVDLPDGVRGHALAENVGIPAGRNAGVTEVSGDLLFFLDDDASLASRDTLARFAALFASGRSSG